MSQGNLGKAPQEADGWACRPPGGGVNRRPPTSWSVPGGFDPQAVESPSPLGESPWTAPRFLQPVLARRSAALASQRRPILAQLFFGPQPHLLGEPELDDIPIVFPSRQP